MSCALIMSREATVFKKAGESNAPLQRLHKTHKLIFLRGGKNDSKTGLCDPRDQRIEQKVMKNQSLKPPLFLELWPLAELKIKPSRGKKQ